MDLLASVEGLFRRDLIMKSHKEIIKVLRLLVVLVAVCVLFMAGKEVLAALYNINTNDNPASVQEWFDQNVPVWHTDAVGDVPVATEDIVNTWVATGNDDRIYFLMELAAAPALETMLREAVAYLDCDGDGDNDGLGDADDVIVAYSPFEDYTKVFTGDQNNGMTLDQADGQRVSQYVEWGIDLRDLPPTNPVLMSSSDCQHAVRIRFLTANTDSYPGVPIDETTPFDGYNIPTAITLDKMGSYQSGEYHFSFFVIIFLVLSGLVLVLYLQYHNRRNRKSSE